MFFVVEILAFVCVCILIVTFLFPDAFANLHSVPEGTAVRVAVSPPVLTITVCLAVVVFAQVDIPVGELVRPLPMSETKFPLSFILITVLPLMDAVSVRFILVPLSDILVAIIALPDPVAMFKTLTPLAIILLSVGPRIQTLAVHFSFKIISQILVPVAEPFVALSVSFIVHPASLVDAAVFINANAKPMALLRFNFASVITVFVTLDSEVWHCFELIKVKQVSQHPIVTQLFLLLLRQHLRCHTLFDLFLSPTAANLVRFQ